MDFTGLVGLAGQLIEAAGVGVMVLGPVAAAVATWRGARRADSPGAFRTFRQSLGKAILLGLEFLVAADIIRTVSQVPTLRRVVVLAVIVFIRTFLSFTLEVELDGRWPWSRRKAH